MICIIKPILSLNSSLSLVKKCKECDIVKICPRCNSENKEEAKFCSFCGFELEKKFENETNDSNIKIKDENLKLILFYKYDKKTHEYSISKTKIITLILSTIAFCIFVNNSIMASDYYNPIYLLFDIIITLILGAITYVIGLSIRYVINKLTY